MRRQARTAAESAENTVKQDLQASSRNTTDLESFLDGLAPASDLFVSETVYTSFELLLCIDKRSSIPDDALDVKLFRFMVSTPRTSSLCTYHMLLHSFVHTSLHIVPIRSSSSCGCGSFGSQGTGRGAARRRVRQLHMPTE